MPELDLHLWPCHPVGTWQRALVFQCAGLEPEHADAVDLERLNRLSEHARRAEVVAARRLTTRVRRAAERALAPGEVLGVNNLALRIKSTDGLPGYHTCKAVLKALSPHNEHDDADLVGKGHQLFKVYRDDLGARPSHLFARHPDDVDAYAARRMARYEEQGRIGTAARLAKASA